MLISELLLLRLPFLRHLFEAGAGAVDERFAGMAQINEAGYAFARVQAERVTHDGMVGGPLGDPAGDETHRMSGNT